MKHRASPWIAIHGFLLVVECFLNHVNFNTVESASVAGGDQSRARQQVVSIRLGRGEQTGDPRRPQGADATTEHARSILIGYKS